MSEAVDDSCMWKESWSYRLFGKSGLGQSAFICSSYRTTDDLLFTASVFEEKSDPVFTAPVFEEDCAEIKLFQL